MKRIFVYFLFFSLILTKNSSAQNTLFWYETFGTGCNQGNLAQGAAPTVTNGPWVVTTLGAPGNGASANEWFVSATEAGRPVGVCGDGCLNNAGFINRSLHIGQNLVLPALDPGAFYNQSATSNTHKRAESPTINCTGKNNITLSFNYMLIGNAPTDIAEVMWYDGAAWNTFVGGTLAATPGTCAPTAQWTNATFVLPPAADGNPGVKIGFRWENGIAVGPGNVSIAVDEIQLLCPTITYSAPTQACATFPWLAVPVLTVAGIDSYSWTSTPVSAFSNSNVQTPTITCPTPGVYTFTVMGSTLGVLTASTTFTANIVSSLVFTASASPATVCPSETTALSVIGGTSHSWTPGPPWLGNPVLVSPSVATIYTVNGFDISGCPGQGTVLVTMGLFPNVSVVGTASAVCVGFSSTLTGAGAANYTWTGTGISPPILQSSVAVGPGTYVVTGSTTPLPCPFNQTVVVSLAPPLNIQVSTTPLTATTCISANFPMTSKPVNLCASGAGVYYWNPSTSLNYSIGPCVAARPLVSTCYTVQGFTSVCSGSAIVCVTVIPQFTMNVIPKQPILCAGDSMKLRIADIGTTSIAPYTYYWGEPANAPPPSIDNILSATVTISPTNMAQPVTYSAEVVDSRGCASVPKLVTCTILPQPLTGIAIPIINGTPVNTVCYVGSSTGSNPNALIELTAINGNSNILPFGVVSTYTWISPYAPTYSPQSILTGINSFSALLAAPLRTPAVVVWTVQSGYNGIPTVGKGCTRFDTVSIRVIDCRSLTPVSTQFTTAIINDTICTRTCINFVNMTDTAAGGPQTYLWTFPGGAPATSTLMNPTICYNLPGKYNVILRAYSPYNQPDGSEDIEARQSYVKVVDIPNPKILPRISVGMDTCIRYGQSITLTATNAVSYIWDPNYNISSTTGSVIIATPRKSTEYHVWGYNSAGCKSTDTIRVCVSEDCGEMFVPSAFSPNGDGVNDVLRVRGFCLESLTFMIFNKWGEKIFETNDQEVGWDGTYKDEEMNTDVFVYRIEGKTFEGKGYSKKGNITLVR